jgi:hypothetical protein
VPKTTLRTNLSAHKRFVMRKLRNTVKLRRRVADTVVEVENFRFQVCGRRLPVKLPR